jgi:glyoxylase-like metal-dependent hydrolase (beta-lactamase superfamily II)
VPSILLTLLDINDQHPPPKLHKFSLDSNDLDSHHVQLTEMLGSLKPGSFHSPEPARPSLNTSVHPLRDGQLLGPLQIIHTPGHTADSISLYLKEEGALFTADSILGHGTAVFEDLSTYLNSLHRLLHTFGNESSLEPHASRHDLDPRLHVIYPGHGPAIESSETALNTIKSYIQHRLDREREYLAVLESRNHDHDWTADEILAQIYPEHVWAMAKRGLLLHLQRLETNHRVVKSISADGTPTWKAVNTIVVQND